MSYVSTLTPLCDGDLWHFSLNSRMVLHARLFHWRAVMKSTFDGKMAKITVNPSLKTIIDQKVDIFVSKPFFTSRYYFASSSHRWQRDSVWIIRFLQSWRERRSIVGFSTLAWRIIYRCRTHGVILEHGTRGRNRPRRYAEKTRCFKTPESFLRCLQRYTYWWEQFWVAWRK